jgi:hypothetical protein
MMPRSRPATNNQGLFQIGICGLGMFVLCAGLLTACGSSVGSSPQSSTAAKAACQQISAVLSNGPDPEADPVGYALAQIRPLGAISVHSDATLQAAIHHLASAYQTFYDDSGKGKSAKQAINAAAKSINDLCPGTGAGV